MNFTISAACGCLTGKRRGNNEDNFYFDGHFLPAKNAGLEKVLTCQYGPEKKVADFGVFDGMGGQADGQIASSLAAEVFADSVRDAAAADRDGHCACLQAVLKRMSDAVWEQAEADFTDMGTTAAVLRLSGDSYYAANVGDSRIFLCRDGQLAQISRDHTDEDLLRETGLLNRKPRLTQFIGISPDELTVNPYVTSGNVLSSDIFLICSDGLTDMVSEKEITAILVSDAGPAARTERLLQRAMENGGRDNITVILVQAGVKEAVTEELYRTLQEEKTVQIRANRETVQKAADQKTVQNAQNLESVQKAQKREPVPRAQAPVREQESRANTRVVLLSVLILILLTAACMTGLQLVRSRRGDGSGNAGTESSSEAATQGETADSALEKQDNVLEKQGNTTEKQDNTLEKQDEAQGDASDSSSGNTESGGVHIIEQSIKSEKNAQ